MQAPLRFPEARAFLKKIASRRGTLLGRLRRARRAVDDVVAAEYAQFQAVLAEVDASGVFHRPTIRGRLEGELEAISGRDAVLDRLVDLLDLLRRESPDGLRRELAHGMPGFEPSTAPPRPLAASPSRFEVADALVRVDGREVRLRYVSTPLPPAGEAPVEGLLLLHGHGSKLEEYSELMEHALARGQACVSFDLPGCGYSSRWKGRLKVSDLVRVVAAFVRHLEAEHPIRLRSIAGGSLGGHLALRLASVPELEDRELLAWAPACLWPRRRWLAVVGRVWSWLPFTFWLTLRVQSLFWYSYGLLRNMVAIGAMLRSRREVWDRGYRRAYWDIALDQLAYSLLEDDALTDALRRRPERFDGPHAKPGEAGLGAVGLLMPSTDAASWLSRSGKVEAWLEAIGKRPVLVRGTGHAIATERPARLAELILRPAPPRCWAGGRSADEEAPSYEGQLHNYGHERNSGLGAVHVPRSVEQISGFLAARRAAGRPFTVRSGGNCLHNQSLANDSRDGGEPRECDTLLLDREALGGRPVPHGREPWGEPPDARRYLTAPAWCQWGDALESATSRPGYLPVISPSSSVISIGGSLSADGVTRMSPALGKESQAVVRIVALLPGREAPVEIWRPGAVRTQRAELYAVPCGLPIERLPDADNDRLFHALVGGHGLVGILLEVTLELIYVCGEPALEKVGRAGDVFVRTWVRNFVDFEDMLEILLHEYRESARRARAMLPRRMDGTIRSSFGLLWFDIGSNMERASLVTNAFGRAPAGLEPKRVPKKALLVPSTEAEEANEDPHERGLGQFGLWKSDTSFFGVMVAAYLMNVAVLRWVVPFVMHLATKIYALRSRRIVERRISKDGGLELIRADYRSAPRGFFFFMDGHHHAQRLLARSGSYPYQQAFAFPIRATGPGASLTRNITSFLRRARMEAKKARISVSVTEVKLQPATETLLSSGGHAPDASIDVQGSFLVTFSIERSDLGAEVRQAYFRTLCDICQQLGGRVHLAKNVFTHERQVGKMYGQDLDAFRALKDEFDEGKLLDSSFAREVFAAEPGASAGDIGQ